MTIAEVVSLISRRLLSWGHHNASGCESCATAQEIIGVIEQHFHHRSVTPITSQELAEVISRATLSWGYPDSSAQVRTASRIIEALVREFPADCGVVSTRFVDGVRIEGPES
jgi:hypothetical protein